ncbi:MAG: hypothetical protein AAFP26_01290 [Planctomycetota bacterium]
MLQDSAKELRRAWSRTAVHWTDANSRAFEMRVIDAADRVARQAGEAMDSLEELAAAARRACADVEGGGSP